MPSVVAIVGWVLLLVAIEIQVRLVEEPHLLGSHGAAYQSYAASAGRFLPWIGRMRVDRAS